MLFSSYIFLFVFLPVTLCGFCLLSRLAGAKPAKLWLTLASLVFYGWWNPIYVALIVASMLFNFWLGSRIGQAVRERSPSPPPSPPGEGEAAAVAPGNYARPSLRNERAWRCS